MNITVSEAEVLEVVGHTYDLHLLHPLVDLPQGVHSEAWLAHTDDGDWVVKISNPSADSPAALASQCELYDFLNSRGLHTPLVKTDRHDRRVSAIAGLNVSYPVTLMRHHELRRPTPESVSTADLRRIAAEIGRLHATMDEFPSKTRIIADREKSLDEWGQQSEGCYDDLLESPTAGCFTTAERSWLKTIDAALVAYLDAHYPDPATLTQAALHGDLSFEHVRFLPNGEVYVFDFGDLSWGPIAHELAQFLRSFQSEPIPFDRWANLRRWLLDGYRSTHLFTATDEAAIDSFVLNRAVGLAKYILELHADNASAEGAQAIKSTYELAEAMLQKRHLTAGPAR